MENSIYLISGLERRKLKKELNSLTQYVKYYWYCDDLNNVYGGDTYSENESNKIINDTNRKINEIKLLLTKLK